MTRILLLGPFPEQAMTLRRMLERRKWDVVVRSADVNHAHVKRLVGNAHVVILSVVLNRPSDWELLQRVCSLRYRCPSLLGVIALCPRRTEVSNPRLLAEDLGARGVCA